MYIILVSGFRGMGKDYFYELLTKEVELSHYYAIWNYSNKSIPIGEYNLIKFATSLKDEVSSILDITIDELNERKELPLNKDYKWKLKSISNAKYRHVLIDCAEYNRSIDEDYYVKEAANLCRRDKINVITDLRYENESKIAKYIDEECKIITIRVHRDNVTVPPKSYVSEHYITDMKPDILLLPRGHKPEMYSDIYPWV